MVSRSPRRTGIGAGAVVLALLVSACGSGESAAPATTATAAETTSAPAQAFPNFTVPTSDGGQIEWSSLQGQDVVLWFWAPW